MSLLKLLRNENGFAAYVALGIISIMTVLGAGLIIIADNELSSVKHNLDRNKAYYLAEMGINHALWKLNQSPAIDGAIPETTFGEGTYETTYSEQVLTSTGTFNGVTRKIIVKTIESTSPSAFDVGVFGGQFNAIPDGVTIWNGLGSTEPNRVVIENYGDSTLTIKGKVLNKPEVSYTEADGKTHPGGAACSTGRHASAYSAGGSGINFVGSSAEGRIATTSSGFLPPSFDSTSDDNKITTAGTYPSSNPNWTTTQTLTPGQTYINGNLIINGTNVITTATQSTNPAELVVSGYVYIDGSTIGNESGDSYIRILAGGNIEFNHSTWTNSVYLKKETQFYSKSRIIINDNTRMNNASILSKDDLTVETKHNPTGSPDIDLKGILFSKDIIEFRANSPDSGTIEFEGGMVAGYSSGDGQIHLYTNANAPEGTIQLTFSQSAKPSELPSAFSVTSGAQLDYTTWREQ
ncbi:MAG: hypothetical protein HY776_02185 [Actinobacteria bacterium]|nr:hypothetical protein [Actinomycetota bacterium]